MRIIPEGFGCKAPKAFVVSSSRSQRRCRTVRLTAAPEEQPQTIFAAFLPAHCGRRLPPLRETW